MMVSDFHSHILPAIDDGSANLEESMQLLYREAEQGIRRVVATPHFYANHHSIERFLEKREAAFDKLKHEMQQVKGLPRIILGAEVHFFRGMSQIEELRDLAIAGTDHILIEMPMSEWTDAMYRELEEIPKNHGLTPIMAHVDRYLPPLRDNGILERLEELPVLIQANASFFLQLSTKAKAMRMLENGQIHLLGSDCHNLKSRPPRLGEAVQVIRKKLGEQPLHEILHNENQILGPLEEETVVDLEPEMDDSDILLAAKDLFFGSGNRKETEANQESSLIRKEKKNIWNFEDIFEEDL